MSLTFAAAMLHANEEHLILIHLRMCYVYPARGLS